MTTSWSRLSPGTVCRRGHFYRWSVLLILRTVVRGPFSQFALGEHQVDDARCRHHRSRDVEDDLPLVGCFLSQEKVEYREQQGTLL